EGAERERLTLTNDGRWLPCLECCGTCARSYQVRCEAPGEVGIVSTRHQNDDGEPGGNGQAPRMPIWVEHLAMCIAAHQWFLARAACDWNAADLLDSTPVLDHGL